MQALFLTSPELIAEYWDRAEVHLHPVVNQAARGEFTVSDIKRLCDEHRAFVAVVLDGDDVVLSLVYEFIFYPRITACNIMCLGGSRLEEAADSFFVTFKEWLHSMGVTVLEASCSSAMSRLLRRYGFEKTYEVVRHEIRLSPVPRPAKLP